MICQTESLRKKEKRRHDRGHNDASKQQKNIPDVVKTFLYLGSRKKGKGDVMDEKRREEKRDKRAIT